MRHCRICEIQLSVALIRASCSLHSPSDAVDAQEFVAASLELSALREHVGDGSAEAAGADAVEALESMGASLGPATPAVLPDRHGAAPSDSSAAPTEHPSDGASPGGAGRGPLAAEGRAGAPAAGADGPGGPAAAVDGQGPPAALHFVVGAPPGGAGLSAALALSVGFAPPPAPAQHLTALLGRDGALTVGIGIWSGIDVPLVETRVEVGRPPVATEHLPGPSCSFSKQDFVISHKCIYVVMYRFITYMPYCMYRSSSLACCMYTPCTPCLRVRPIPYRFSFDIYGYRIYRLILLPAPAMHCAVSWRPSRQPLPA